jgi:hypothetical protein
VPTRLDVADIMGYYSRQTCGHMIRTVFKNVAEQLQAVQEAEMSNVGGAGAQRAPDCLGVA